MRKYILLYLIILSSSLYAQLHYTFSDLRGLEDDSGNTRLFYKLNYNGSYSHIFGSRILRYDTHTGLESFIFGDGGGIDFYHGVSDYEFINKDYRKYIAAEYLTTMGESFSYFRRYSDNESVFLDSAWFTHPEHIEITPLDTNFIIIALQNGNLKSTDYGNSWKRIAEHWHILSLSAFDTSIIFAGAWDKKLYQSIDGGLHFAVIDTGREYYKNFVYDPDSVHIYALASKPGGEQSDGKEIMVSDNNGTSFSWSPVFTGSKGLIFCNDPSIPGSLYAADRKYIYYSADYGASFNIIHQLDRKITGLYKKPGSSIIYACTDYDLYEINGDSVVSLKRLEIDPGIFSWLPLQKGNKWFFEYKIYDVLPYEQGKYTIEVTGTVLSGDKNYAVLTYTNYNERGDSVTGTRNEYFRIDSLTGKVYYSYDTTGTHDQLYVDLTLSIGDTILPVPPSYYQIYFQSEEPETFKGFSSTIRTYELDMVYIAFSLLKGVGFYHESGGELIFTSRTLLGARINGTVYGDTLLTGVEEIQSIPVNYSLSQNYPNPFNPATRINYSINSREHVTLKIYNVLGTHIATMVNEEKPAGEYEITFDAASYNLSSGVYFYTITAGEFTETKKFTLLK